MAIYAIGDVQGCFDELLVLLDKIRFNPKQDQLWFAGDLVNRGPKSVEVLRYIKNLGDRAVAVLGNHDFHLLAVSHGCGKKLRQDTLQPVLDAPDSDELISWLRHRPLLHHDETVGFTMVHAGLPPQWNLSEARQYAAEVEALMRSDEFGLFLDVMYSNLPDIWNDDLKGFDRVRFIVNCMSRLRYCDQAGRLALEYKGAPGSQPDGVIPWFDVSGRRSADESIVFGHWSTLGIGLRNNTWSLDSGCLWGGKLTALRLDSEPEWFQVTCDSVCLSV
ncbi:MAG TPA: symmetrical bis(5'-nucleosyl)-tetraphosphatase [Gammaproteobacteria bacterium]|nr:symmetrical bis(5'-nucleosyl)-tetraphosphatase [Gammaproteobacteria bacterium]